MITAHYINFYWPRAITYAAAWLSMFCIEGVTDIVRSGDPLIKKGTRSHINNEKPAVWSFIL